MIRLLKEVEVSMKKEGKSINLFRFDPIQMQPKYVTRQVGVWLLILGLEVGSG